MTAIEHARYSHQNITETLRFVDGKTAGLAAFTTGLAGLSFFLIRLLTGIDSELVPPTACLSSWAVICILTSLVCATGSVILCVFVNIARPRETTGFVALFPFHNSQDLECKKAKIREILENTDEARVLDEFSDQLTNLGVIVSKKIFYFRKASYCFIGQAVFVVFGVFLIAINWFSNS